MVLHVNHNIAAYLVTYIASLITNENSKRLSLLVKNNFFELI